MNHNSIVLKVVSMIGIAVRARLVRRAAGHARERTGQKTSGAAVWPARMGWRPNLVVPRDDVSLRIEASAHFHEHRRTKWFPHMFVVTHPLDAHRLSHRLRSEE